MGALGRNISYPIHNADGTSFHGLVLHKSTYESVVMSLDDKITGDIYYPNNTLNVTMKEYIEFKHNPDDPNEDPVKFILVNPPTIVKDAVVGASENAGMTKYTFVFYHPMCRLTNMPFGDVAVSDDEKAFKSQDKTFFWVGNLNDFVQKIKKNLQGTDWTIELNSQQVPSDTITLLSDVLSFDNNTIADAIKTAYDTWNVPYTIRQLKSSESEYSSGKRFCITFGNPSQVIYTANSDGTLTSTEFVFRCGQNVGLKNNSRTPRNNKIVTRIAGYGSETNVPFGYPQIEWYGTGEKADWDYTINNQPGVQSNVTVNGVTYSHIMSYPIYNGIVGGQRVRLIKHPFTRSHLMPTVYSETLFNKVSPYVSGGGANPYFDPEADIIEYYDAISDGTTTYPNEINPQSPSYEAHEFPEIKPELSQINTMTISSAVPIKNDRTEDTLWIDDVDDDGNYLQSYFKITLPALGFDLYACAALTQEMKINMRSGACIGCTFEVMVDWEAYRQSFYDENSDFDPTTNRNYTLFPDSTSQSISIILQKDTSTFGTLMPNIYQNPSSGDEFVILGISLPSEYISAAEENLDTEAKAYMLKNNVYMYDYPLKFDEHFLAVNSPILAQIKTNTVVSFVFGETTLQLYVNKITIKHGFSPLPEYDITLSDSIDILLNQLGTVSETVDELSLLIASMRQSTEKDAVSAIAKKLSRVSDDTAQGVITFSKGFSVGANQSKKITDIVRSTDSPSASDNALLTALRSNNQFARKDQNDNINSLWTFQPSANARGIQTRDYTENNLNEDNLFGHGFQLVQKDDRSRLEVDELLVRVKAFFASLEIREISYLGGNYVFSAAGSKVYYVEWLDAQGNILQKSSANLNAVAKFRCYMYSDDGTTATINKWAVNDQARCQTFNIEEGVHQNVSNKFYWRLVVAKGKEVIAAKTDDTNQYQYVDLSNVSTEYASLSDIPEEGDSIVQMGNWTDTSRQGMIYLMLEGENSPAIMEYDGIGVTHFVLPDPSMILSPKKNVIHGEFHSIAYADEQPGSVNSLFSALTSQINSIKTQSDQKFDIWFGEGIPYPNADVPNNAANYPASEWETTALKELHLQDLYYDMSREAALAGGRAWRWVSSTEVNENEEEVTTFYWDDVTDADTIASLEKIADVASDGKLTGGAEKTRVYIDWLKCVQEYIKYTEQASDYGLNVPATGDTPYNNYVAAYTALATLLNNGTAATESILRGTSGAVPSWLSNLQTTTTINNPTTYRSTWNAYYAALAALLQAITDKINDVAEDAAQDATTSLSILASMGDDSKLEANEKLTVKREFIACYHEMMDTDDVSGLTSGVLDMALGVLPSGTTVDPEANGFASLPWKVTYADWVAPYVDAFRAVGTFLNDGSAWEIPTLADYLTDEDAALPIWIQEDETNTPHISATEDIDGDEWRELWAKFYAARTTLLNGLTEKAQNTADNLADDGILSAGSEKSEILVRWNDVLSNYKKYGAQAEDYLDWLEENFTDTTTNTVTVTEYTLLSRALNGGSGVVGFVPSVKALGTFLNGGTTWNNDYDDQLFVIPKYIKSGSGGTFASDTILSENSQTASNYRICWDNYYENLNGLVVAINSASKLMADTAKTAADSAVEAIENISSDGVLSIMEIPDLKREFEAAYRKRAEMVDLATYDSGTNAHHLIDQSLHSPLDAYLQAFSAFADYLNMCGYDIYSNWEEPTGNQEGDGTYSVNFSNTWTNATYNVVPKEALDDEDFPILLQSTENVTLVEDWSAVNWQEDNGATLRNLWADLEQKMVALSNALARDTRDIADSKIQCFVGDEIPTPPYKVNDLWQYSDNNGLSYMLVCNTSRASGAGQFSEWTISSETDLKEVLANFAENVYKLSDNTYSYSAYLAALNVNQYIQVFFQASSPSYYNTNDLWYDGSVLKKRGSSDWSSISSNDYPLLYTYCFLAMFVYVNDNGICRIFNQEFDDEENYDTLPYDYDLLVAPFVAHDPVHPTDPTYDMKGGLDIRLFFDNGERLVTIRESVHGFIDNFGNYIRAVVTSSTSAAGFFTTSNFASLFAQALDNNSDIAGAIGVGVTFENGVPVYSQATIDADLINFKTGYFEIENQNNQTTFGVDADGNIEIKGVIHADKLFTSIKRLKVLKPKYLNDLYVDETQMVGVPDDVAYCNNSNTLTASRLVSKCGGVLPNKLIIYNNVFDKVVSNRTNERISLKIELPRANAYQGHEMEIYCQCYLYFEVQHGTQGDHIEENPHLPVEGNDSPAVLRPDPDYQPPVATVTYDEYQTPIFSIYPSNGDNNSNDTTVAGEFYHIIPFLEETIDCINSNDEGVWCPPELYSTELKVMFYVRVVSMNVGDNSWRWMVVEKDNCILHQ